MVALVTAGGRDAGRVIGLALGGERRRWRSTLCIPRTAPRRSSPGSPHGAGRARAYRAAVTDRAAVAAMIVVGDGGGAKFAGNLIQIKEHLDQERYSIKGGGTLLLEDSRELRKLADWYRAFAEVGLSEHREGRLKLAEYLERKADGECRSAQPDDPARSVRRPAFPPEKQAPLCTKPD